MKNYYFLVCLLFQLFSCVLPRDLHTQKGIEVAYKNNNNKIIVFIKNQMDSTIYIPMEYFSLVKYDTGSSDFIIYNNGFEDSSIMFPVKLTKLKPKSKIKKTLKPEFDAKLTGLNKLNLEMVYFLNKTDCIKEGTDNYFVIDPTSNCLVRDLLQINLDQE